ncbi:MAG TPA: MoxR family ATPase [Chloroflexota bacterium]|nr:MoxR family ATPase [Chloroflexota bacterium]
MRPKEFRDAALERVRRVVVEADVTFELLLAAFLVGGNVLVEGVPGTAKTLMARLLAQLLGPSNNVDSQASGVAERFRRIQFTPDLMPSDIVGTNVFNAATATFTLRAGPVFANVVVADEINRAPAKTQSALLEAMEEHQVTIEGQRLPLPPVFMVVATQNPVEFEGTYPLPEAQLDRFLFKLLVGYASAEAERDIVLLHHRGFALDDLAGAGVTPLVDEAGVLALREQVAAVTLETSVVDYLVAVERATRSAPEAQYGSSVRGALGLMRGAKAVAAFAGRDYVTPDDVKQVAPGVLRHRLVLRPEAELDGVTPDDVVTRILGSVPVPR